MLCRMPENNDSGIMGAEKSMELLKHRNIEALFITDDKKVYVTKNSERK